MANLAVTVNVNGALAATALSVSVWPATTFGLQPQRGHAAPNTAATATGTLSGGSVTLTGLSSVNYQLLVVDARGVNNWWFVPAAYVGGSYVASIPWSTPTQATKAVSIGGDTPGGPLVMAPWAQRLHFHEFSAPTTPVLAVALPPTAPPAGTYKAVGVASNGNWIIGGTTGLSVSTDKGNTWTQTNTNAFSVTAISVSGNNVLAVGSATAITVAFKYSTDGGNTWSAVGTVTGPASLSGNPQSCLWLGSNWWVCSGTATPNLYKSTNNGTSWTTVALPSASPSNQGAEPFCLLTDGASLLVAVGTDEQTGSNTNYVYSTDAGATWNNPAGSAVAAGGGPNGFLVDSNHFVIGNGSNGNLDFVNITAHSVLASGLSYAQTTAGKSSNNAVSGIGALGGASSGTGQPVLFWTTNGGTSWNTTSSPLFTTQVNDLAWISSSSLLAVGTGGPNAPLVIVTGIS